MCTPHPSFSRSFLVVPGSRGGSLTWSAIWPRIKGSFACTLLTTPPMTVASGNGSPARRLRRSRFQVLRQRRVERTAKDDRRSLGKPTNEHGERLKWKTPRLQHTTYMCGFHLRCQDVYERGSARQIARRIELGSRASRGLCALVLYALELEESIDW